MFQLQSSCVSNNRCFLFRGAITCGCELEKRPCRPVGLTRSATEREDCHERHVTSACLTGTMSLTLELNCLVLGDDPSHVFTIEIVDSKNVSALKKAIKDEKKHAFQHVDADTLNIFRVSFPEDDDLDATLKSFRPEHDPENGVHSLSKSMKRLKGVFGGPIDEHLHVIVLPPAGE
jgi:hypothetical protein